MSTLKLNKRDRETLQAMMDKPMDVWPSYAGRGKYSIGVGNTPITLNMFCRFKDEGLIVKTGSQGAMSLWGLTDKGREAANAQL